jgi:phage FluMu protein Com
MLRIECKCGKILKVAENLAGKKIKCPSCGAVLLVQAKLNSSEVGTDLEESVAVGIKQEESAKALSNKASPNHDEEKEEQQQKRPRKKKRAKKSKGIAPALLIAGGASLLLVFASLGCWLFLLKKDSGPSGFQEFSSAAGGFKVQIPGSPKEKTINHNGIALHLFTVDEKNGSYGVGYADADLSRFGNPQLFLDLTAQEMVKNANCDVQTLKKTTLEGKHLGVEFQGRNSKSKSAAHFRIYLVNSRLYQVIVNGTEAWVGSENATKFMDSFALLK